MRKIPLPFSVYMNNYFIPTGTDVYILPIANLIRINAQVLLTVRRFYIPKPTYCAVYLYEDDANFHKIKYPEAFI